MHLVVDIECVVYYFMLLNDLTYEEAYANWGLKEFVRKTAKKYKLAQVQCWLYIFEIT